jgi:hypothetical protein
MKRHRHTDAVKIAGEDRPAENVTEEIWITRKGLRMDAPGQSMLLFSLPPELIVMDHRKKTYIKRELKQSPPQFQITEGNDPKKATAVREIGDTMMKIEAVVKVTDEMQKISSWNCRKYFLTVKTFMGKIENEIWATEDLKISAKFSDHLAVSMIFELPGIENSIRDVKSEVRKIKGVPVKTISTRNLMNKSRRTVTELMEFKETKAPENILEIPKEYLEKTIKQGKGEGADAFKGLK